MNKVNYAGGVNTENTSASPSKEIWGSMPADILYDPSVGYHFYDDFLEFPTITTPTITTEIEWGNRGYKAFGSAGGTITKLAVSNGVGGVVFTETDDNQGLSLATIALPFKIDIGQGKFWFEARIKSDTITDTRNGWVLGLWEQQTLSATVPIAAAGTLADANFVGFHRLEGDGDAVDTVYKADGVTQVTVGTDAVTLVADTYVKLGMIFEPATNILTFYKNGVPLANTKTIPTADGTDFPNDVQMGLCFAMLCASNDDAVNTLGWWRAAQLRP